MPRERELDPFSLIWRGGPTPRRAMLRKGVVDIVDEYLWCSEDLEVGELFDLLVQHRRGLF